MKGKYNINVHVDTIEEELTCKKALFNKKRRHIYEGLVQEELRYQ
jgi:hypothetical protein